ncbi:MAG: hypothetical protein ACWGSQ_17385 [Longimicrobiales bacterium]
MTKKRKLPSLLAPILALLADVVTHGVPALGPSPSQRSLDAALAAQAQVTDEWLARPGVIGTAVGFGHAKQAVLKVYVTTLGAAALPRSVSGIPVSVEVTGPFVSFADPPPGTTLRRTFDEGSGESADLDGIDRKGSFPRPVPIGVSTGHPDVTAGTIGARVTDGARIFALSNNHVFAANNRGRIGDNLLQPGVADGGRNPEDLLATLFDFEPLKFCAGTVCPLNLMDAALALTSAENLGTETPEDGYGSPRPGTAEAALGMKVQKYGRTTGHTQGQVSGINAIIDVNYRTGVARFEGQIMISGEAFSAGGDSGSLIVTKGLLAGDRRPVGLLFAGSANNTIANPIDLVLDRFGVRVEGG